MNINVESRVHRVFKNIPNYHKLPDRLKNDECNYSVADLPHHDDEHLIGIYENEMGAIDKAIAIGTRSLYLQNANGWIRLEYVTIVSIDYNNTKSEMITGLIVSLQDGRSIEFPIAGGNPETGSTDATHFMRFLMRVRDDQIREHDEP